MTLILISLGWCLTHQHGRGWICCSKVLVVGVHFRPGRGKSAKLLGMSVAFDWLEPQGWNLVRTCRVSGATVVYGCASVCMLLCLWDRYEWRVHICDLFIFYPYYCVMWNETAEWYDRALGLRWCRWSLYIFITSLHFNWNCKVMPVTMCQHNLLFTSLCLETLLKPNLEL